MSFVEDMYKPKPNLYLKEKSFVHNLFITGVMKRSAENNKDRRYFEGYYYSYNSVPGDGDTGVTEVNSTKFTDVFLGRGNLDYKVIEKLIYEEVQNSDIGFKSFEVKIVEKIKQRQIKDGYNFFGNPKYKNISEPVKTLWFRATW